MNQRICHVFWGLCLSMGTIGAAPANASTTSDALPARTVSYADLDLSKPAGAQTLYRRISAAAQAVCAPFMHEELFAFNRRASGQACIDKAIGDAVQTVNASTLNDQFGKHAIQVARN